MSSGKQVWDKGEAHSRQGVELKQNHHVKKPNQQIRLDCRKAHCCMVIHEIDVEIKE